jgi:hypothetical protein
MDYTGFKGDSDEELVNGPMGSTIREQKVTLRHPSHCRTLTTIKILGSNRYQQLNVY